MVLAQKASAQERLLAAAVMGLLGILPLAGCDRSTTGGLDSIGSSEDAGTGDVVAPEGSDAGAPASDGGTGNGDVDAQNSDDGGGSFVNILSNGVEISYDDFTKRCESRGGFVTTNANCAGSNLCKGLSYMAEGAILTEHSCAAANQCAGMSCVDTPADSNISGKDLYENGPCIGCHGATSDPSLPDQYVVFFPPGTTATDAMATFKASSRNRLLSIVAFGTQGLNRDGMEFANMPAYRQKYSRAEIERVLDYLLGLEAVTREYTVPGTPYADGGSVDVPAEGAGSK